MDQAGDDTMGYAIVAIGPDGNGRLLTPIVRYYPEMLRTFPRHDERVLPTDTLFAVDIRRHRETRGKVQIEATNPRPIMWYDGQWVQSNAGTAAWPPMCTFWIEASEWHA
jgi:hypothetical protein